MERRPMRYAHAEGHTEITYTENGESLVTCGTDGDVRVWAGLEDDDPRSVCVGEWALGLALSASHLFVSTDNNAIQKYTFPAFDKDGVVTRFTAPVTQIAMCKTLPKLGCCSENMEARLCSIEDKTVSGVMSHEGPVLSMSVCPLGKYGATSCGDGFCRIWNLEDNSILKQMHCVPKANSFYSAKVLGRTSFETNTGKYLAYPSNREVVILDTKTWQQKYTLTHPKIKCSVSQCLFSPCGNYIAASTIAGQIVFWNVNTSSVMGVTEHPTSHNVCSMAWNPSAEDGELAFCDVSGQLGTIINCFGGQGRRKSTEDDDNLDLMEIIERENQDSNDGVRVDRDDDDDDAISLNRLKKQGAGEDAESVTASSRRRSRSRSLTPERRMQAQPPFQPSATPVHLEHRYMCWNEVGIVRSHSSEVESSIEVEFHDTSTHHSIHLNNHLNHIIAALSSTVLVLACEAPGKLVCITLAGGSKEWSVSLPDLEEAVCVAATDSLVAAATSARFLRLYTPLGTQIHVVSLLGSPVCLVGRGSSLHVMYHAADPGVSDQHIAMDTILVKGMNTRVVSCGVRVALSPGCLVRWAGCTDRGAPVTLDSAGVLRLYQPQNRLWLPICITANHVKGVSDNFYIVSVSEESECARAILCRGSPFPLTAPRPTLSTLPLQLPFCEMDTEKSQFEEHLRRLAIFGDPDIDRIKLEVALKLFALACRSDVEQRASELIEVLEDKKTMAPAARYASRLGKLHLADKLSSISNNWESQEIVDSSSFASNSLHTSTLQPVQDTEDSEDLDASLILQHPKQKEEILPLKPAPLRTFSGRNPFRKSSDVIESNGGPGTRPLSLTDRQLVNQENTPKPNSVVNNVPVSNGSPLPAETFIQWYGRNKERLQEENGDLSSEELAKLGMKTFKAQQQTKRKLSPAKECNQGGDANTAPSKQSKLSAFAFQKRIV